jgi:hypothetical protein
MALPTLDEHLSLVECRELLAFEQLGIMEEVHHWAG